MTELRSGIVEQAGRDPLIEGTDISAYRVAALAEEQSVPEILADYPSLTEEQVIRAIGYAFAHPKAGRPYPPQNFIRAAGKLADMGAFDPVESEAEE